MRRTVPTRVRAYADPAYARPGRVRSQDVDSEVWRTADGVQLAQSRRSRQETQGACAAALQEMGAAAASQGSVSNWETGRTSPGDMKTIAAIRRYCAAASSRGGADDDASRVPDTSENAAGFEDVVAELTGSPILSDRQARLLDVLMDRLASGVPLSSADGDVVRLLLQTLRLPRP